MSRISLQGKSPDVTLIVGLDRPLGQWFYQVWDYSKDDEAPIRCSMSDCAPGFGASRSKVLSIIADYAAPSPEKDKVESCIGLDLDPGDVATV